MDAQGQTDRNDGEYSSSFFKLVLPLFVSTLLSLPFIYAFVAQQGANSGALNDYRAPHIWMAVAATFAVMTWCLRTNGRIDQKLASVLTRTAIVFGSFALLTLVFRQYHSNRVIFASLFMSAILGSLVMLCEHVSRRPKVALIGEWHPLANRLRQPVTLIENQDGCDLKRFDIILTTGFEELSPAWSRPFSRAMIEGRQIRHLAEYVEEMAGVISIEHLELEFIRANSLSNYHHPKRAIDIFLVIFALPIAVPIFVIGALSVFIGMGRPIMFVQPRVGLGGKIFSMYKLRTMTSETSRGSARATGKGDTRVTHVGRVLRRFRVDELPQLWNVLKGDMSVIGPRPEQPSLSDAYIKDMPAFAYRQVVRPGITGWAQVKSGYAADLAETREKLTHDLYYIKHVSFPLDIQILIRTIWTLVAGGGVR